MIVNEVIYSDFSLLVDGYVKAKAEHCGAGAYGVKANSYFDNMMLSFHLSKVNFIELLGIRKLCTSIIPINTSINPANFDISSSKDNDASANCNERFHQLANNLESIRRSINDISLEYPFEKDSILMMGSYSFEMIARFEGSNIMSVIGLFPESKFYNAELCNFEVPEKDVLDNVLISDFIKSLYGTINSQLSSVDILTDVMTTDKFFSYVSPDINVKLSHVTTSFGEIRVLNSTSQGISSELRRVKSNLTDLQSVYAFGTFCTDDIIYHVVLDTPIQTYIILQLYTDFIYAEDDLKVLFASDKNAYFIPDELDNFNARLTSLISGVNELIKDIVSISKQESEQTVINDISITNDTARYGSIGTQTIKNQSSVFDRIGIYRLIPASTYIHYSLHFKKSDFLKVINSIPRWLMTRDLDKLHTSVVKYFSTIEQSVKIN